MTDFTEILKLRLEQELPGFLGHSKMIPLIEGKKYRKFDPTPDAKKNAVMIIIFPKQGKLNVVLTLRSMNLSSHKGQISFPGGRIDKGESSLECAIRETEEEIGLALKKNQIIGKLSDLFVEPSNSLITPYIAYLDELPKLRPNPDEVEEIFFTPLDFLIDEANIKIEKTKFKLDDVDIPFWDVKKRSKLWGATAMILSEFIIIYKEIKKF